MSKKCVCGHEMTAAEWKHEWVCHRCGRKKPIEAPMTNADHIRSMSDEELAKFLLKFASNVNSFRGRVIDWLKQPHKEEV